MRVLLLGILLFAVYAATSVLAASAGADHSVAEAHQLLVAESLVDDGDLDVSDEYADESHRSFHPLPLETNGRELGGRLHEPIAPGFPALIAPVLALGGAGAVVLLCAALAAAAFAGALDLARRIVPDPWATGGILVVALSPPAVAHATSVDPAWAGALLLTVAIRLTVETREEARAAPVAGAALALALLPWLDVALALAGLPVAALLLHWTLRQHRRLVAVIAFEVLSASLVAYTAVSQLLFGGLTPLSVALAGEAAFGAETAGGYVSRAPRLVALWLDRHFGMLRWAPVLALAFHGMWLLWRSRREHIARALPERRAAEAIAALATGTVGVLMLVAAFALREVAGDWFPGRWLVPGLPAAAVLVAWSLRHLPRVGVALAALTLLTTAWLLVGLFSGAVASWAEASGTSAPWGPLELVFPTWGTASPWAYAITGALAAGLVVLVANQWLERRRSALPSAAGRRP